MGSEIIVIPAIFIGLPWVIFHYITKWKQAPKITDEDERLLDEMYNLARRLEDRLNTVERIVAADNPDWKPGLNAPQPPLSQSSYAASNYQLDRRN
ncbi:envelope stress response membrane protein PspB [Sphingomonas sp. MA1305]|uniref:envelope stress response membrane protein PspB n=1 Tax=unclassified Sphingomonas TaxID=196159 RepID=UPI0018DFA5B1|nr:envelope stress response membrane protein PspB [Sphingomonas sp. MA1305]MBI0474562.1 envelope stress response membrane protein PspB [Sphingomonas sp. MA1305]